MSKTITYKCDCCGSVIKEDITRLRYTLREGQTSVDINPQSEDRSGLLDLCSFQCLTKILWNVLSHGDHRPSNQRSVTKPCEERQWQRENS